MSAIVIIGGANPLGLSIAAALAQAGAARETLVTFRTERAWPLAPLDLADPRAATDLFRGARAGAFLPILTVSEGAAQAARGLQRAVFLSSHNVRVAPEDPVYARLLTAEAGLRAAAPAAEIIRPTMIYGYDGDGNLSALMRAMRRAPLLPRPGAGDATQQPLYYDDLGREIARRLLGGAGPAAAAMAGPDIVSQRRLFAMVREAANARCAIIPAPIGPARAIASFIPALRVWERRLARAGADKAMRDDDAILGATPLREGLARLAASLDAAAPPS